MFEQPPKQPFSHIRVYDDKEFGKRRITVDPETHQIAFTAARIAIAEKNIAELAALKTHPVDVDGIAIAARQNARRIIDPITPPPAIVAEYQTQVRHGAALDAIYRVNVIPKAGLTVFFGPPTLAHNMQPPEINDFVTIYDFSRRTIGSVAQIAGEVVSTIDLQKLQDATMGSIHRRNLGDAAAAIIAQSNEAFTYDFGRFESPQGLSFDTPVMYGVTAPGYKPPGYI